MDSRDVVQMLIFDTSGPNVVIPPEPIFVQPTMARRPPTPPVSQEHALAGIVHKERASHVRCPFRPQDPSLDVIDALSS
jgi:hypothetical protein